jgi:osmotically-inducible protein OsmY
MAGALAQAGNSPDSRHGTDALASAGIGPASHEADNREGKKMTNDRLRAQVAAELGWNPKVDSKDITVSADGGMVTLHGTVGSCRQKREADNAARRVYGVTGISNYLEVHIPDRDRRADADVRADVRQALLLNCLIPATVEAKVEVSVDNPLPGVVVLSGAVSCWAERDEAVAVAWSAPGITDIDDRIVVAY